MSRSVSKRSSRCGRRTLAVRLLVLLMVLVIVAPFASSSSEEQCQIGEPNTTQGACMQLSLQSWLVDNVRSHSQTHVHPRQGEIVAS